MRLIDADVAYKVLAEYYHHRTETQYEALKEALSKVPTVNAEPVVRCKDCKHFIKYENWEYGHCELITPTIAMDKEWFCPNGERKKDE